MDTLRAMDLIDSPGSLQCNQQLGGGNWGCSRRRLLSYQESFNANWICRDVVLVKVKTPAPLVRFPAESMMTRLSFGDAKLGRLKTLKNSDRNCALNASEIFGIGMFLKREKSILTRPGPITELRPAFPSRVLVLGAAKHCSLT